MRFRVATGFTKKFAPRPLQLPEPLPDVHERVIDAAAIPDMPLERALGLPSRREQYVTSCCGTRMTAGDRSPRTNAQTSLNFIDAG